MAIQETAQRREMAKRCGLNMKVHRLKRISRPELAVIAFLGIITGSVFWALTRRPVGTL